MIGYIEEDFTVIEATTIIRNGEHMIIERRIRSAAPWLTTMATNTSTMSAPQRSQLDAQLKKFEEKRQYIHIKNKSLPVFLMYTYNDTHSPDVTADEAKERIEHDWSTLLANPNVAIEDLRWCEYVHGDFGRTDQGATIMY